MRADLGQRIDDQGAELSRRIDSLESELSRRIDARGARLEAMQRIMIQFGGAITLMVLATPASVLATRA